VQDELPPLEGLDDGRGEEDEDMAEAGPSSMALMQVDETASNAVVLHEDKKYYPDASEVYGEGVETLVQEEDAQPITQPIIEPVKVRKFAIEEEDLPETRFEREFMMNLMNFPEMVRNVAVVGHLHHGKTSLLDTLVYETHKMEVNVDKPVRYTDSHLLERDRGISIKSAPLSLVLQNTKGKSYLCNLIDTPGHTNFVDEVAASCRLADGVVLMVDVVEGVMCNTEAIIKHCIVSFSSALIRV
jgi:116 kDa U5 small nuclear ribonucleoprotein component